VQAEIPAKAWMLLLGNLFWVLAYDTEYAMVDRDDDLRIGMKTSAITLGRWDVVAVMAFYGLHLAIWSWVVSPVLAGWGWWMGVTVAAVQVLWHWSLIRTRTREGCFKAFRLNHWVGMALFCGIVVAYLGAA
jgi:4-hydroxybenzoate polyprenyltransferase